MTDAMEELGSMLLRREGAEPTEFAVIDAEITARFSRRCAVLMTDMSGFSKTTAKHGIISFLAMIERMKGLCLPHVARQGGHLVKIIGDDLFCSFETADDAVKAAIGMLEACATDAVNRPAEQQIRLAVGIGYGDILDIDGMELFGNEVNLASKLGEDMAEPGEILITEAAVNSTGDVAGWWFDARKARISGVSFGYFSLLQNS